MSQLSEITLEYHEISAKYHWISRISHKYPKYQGSDLPDKGKVNNTAYEQYICVLAN